jgi:hypothetical protein
MKRNVLRSSLVLTAVAALAVIVVMSGAGSLSTPKATEAAATAPTCQLGNGVTHVINIVFDNVHFARDNPNVPSDLEQMPHLLNFLKSNGTVFSNSHTPLIAHTADDSLSIYTGLYGDRHGQPVTNTYHTYNPDGTTDQANSFAYWTSPVIDSKTNPPVASTKDSAPTMAYSDTVPATGAPNRITPAPWVPFTRAGCTVGDFSTANMVLENATVDIPTVFGATSPEAAETAANTGDPFRDVQVAKYVGEAIHCAKGDLICANSQRPVTDSLPDEPGNYNGFQALFGAKYIAPAIGGGASHFNSHGHQVTDANGNLVDLNGHTLAEPFTNTPGFPGFNPTATQSLAVIADMQEAGIPVTYGYISDLHEKKADTRTGCTTTANSATAGRPVGPGDSCYVANAQHYDAAFQAFFTRLAEDGITPANTLFVISSEENDQFAGANVGRAVAPLPAGCDGVTIPCNYPTGKLGELSANINGLLAGTASDPASPTGTKFDLEAQGASIYVRGNPSANDAKVRQLERDTAAMTANDPYSGVNGEKVAAYQAGALEQRVLHMQSADPLRTPTYSIFPKPDYFFGTTDTGGQHVGIFSNFAYDHGYYSPNIDVTWVGMAGPGVAHHGDGVDGPAPADGNQPSDPESHNTVPQASTVGTWVEETDIRPTMLYLAGLTDDYQSDGHVITQALASAPNALQATQDLSAGYDQINSSVGQFATDTLIADSKALASGSSSSDNVFATEQETLAQLADDRDAAAAKIKQTLSDAAAGDMPNKGEITSGLAHVKELLNRAAKLAGQ